MGEVSDTLLSTATFEVGTVDGCQHQFKICSYYWQGQYLCVPAIDYYVQRRSPTGLCLEWRGRSISRSVCTSTMLRKIATHSRDGDVWIASLACV